MDERDQVGTTTYVAQENVEIVRLKDVTHGDLLIVHDDEVCTQAAADVRAAHQ